MSLASLSKFSELSPGSPLLATVPVAFVGGLPPPLPLVDILIGRIILTVGYLRLPLCQVPSDTLGLGGGMVPSRYSLAY